MALAIRLTDHMLCTMIPIPQQPDFDLIRRFIATGRINQSTIARK